VEKSVMPFPVLLTNDAARDLNNPPRKADSVLDKIEKTFCTLFELPDRGVYPKELLKLGSREYREIFFKPYRIIYRVMDRCLCAAHCGWPSRHAIAIAATIVSRVMQRSGREHHRFRAAIAH
jgi:toxin ParE1/3/4